MITIDPCSKQDVDRLLGLADQFLDDWAEDAVQGGKPDEDYEERSAEWPIIRPLLVFAPTLLRALKDIASLCRGSAAPMALHCAGIIRSATDGLPLKSDSQMARFCSLSRYREFIFRCVI
jgi:hypothetical protein